MGAAGSVVEINGESRKVEDAMQDVLKGLEEEAAKPETNVDTPRGESAKAEVARLRQLLKKSVQDSELIKGAMITSDVVSEDTARENEEEDDRIPCEKCQRKFRPDRVEKHQSICKGTNTTKPTDNAEANTQSASEAEDGSAKVAGWKADRARMKEQLKLQREKAKANPPASGVITGLEETQTSAPAEEPVKTEGETETSSS